MYLDTRLFLVPGNALLNVIPVILVNCYDHFAAEVSGPVHNQFVKERQVGWSIRRHSCCDLLLRFTLKGLKNALCFIHEPPPCIGYVL